MTEHNTKIAKLREDRGLSQSELARRIGSQPSTISRLESGHRRVTDVYMRKIARALGVDITDLVDTASGEVTMKHLIPVVGECSSSMWRVAEAIAYDQTIPVIPSLSMNRFTNTAYKVEDDHAADLVAAGGYVITVPLKSLRDKALPTDWLVVRSREGRMERHSITRAIPNGPATDFELEGKRTTSSEENAIVGIVVGIYREVV